VEEHPDVVVAILDRRVKHALPADGRDVVLVETAKRRGVAEREALEQRRLTADVAEGNRTDRLAVSLLVAIAGLPEVSFIEQVAVEAVDGSSQSVTRVQALTCVSICSSPCVVSADPRNPRVCLLRVGRMCQRLHVGETHTAAEAHAWTEGKRDRWLERQSIAVGLRDAGRERERRECRVFPRLIEPSEVEAYAKLLGPDHAALETEPEAGVLLDQFVDVVEDHSSGEPVPAARAAHREVEHTAPPLL